MHHPGIVTVTSLKKQEYIEAVQYPVLGPLS